MLSAVSSTQYMHPATPHPEAKMQTERSWSALSLVCSQPHRGSLGVGRGFPLLVIVVRASGDLLTAAKSVGW